MFLVTGGAGFIGSHIVERLVRNGEQVRVLDNFSTGRPENLAHIPGAIDIVDADLRDTEAVQSAVRGIEVIFHEAADASVPRSMAEPSICYETNVMGTLGLLDAARNAGVRRVVFASSCAIYGDDPQLPKREEMLPAPTSPYAASKVAGEDLCQLYSRVFGIETVRLRYFNVFGPRQDPASAYAPVIPRFIAAAMENRNPTIFGDGEQTRDFVYVDDVVEANMLAAHAPNASGQVFNIGSGRPVSLNELVALLAEIMGKPIHVDYVEERAGDIRHSAADTSAARAIGFSAGVSFQDGLSRTVQATQGWPER